jgi:hypothetical protein
VAVVLLELALTKGAGALAAGFTKLAKAATKMPAISKGIATMMGFVMKLVRQTLDRLDDFISLVGRLPIPGARIMADAFKRLRATLVRWSEDLQEAVRKKKKGKDDDEDKDDRSKSRKVADKVFEKAAPDPGSSLLTEKALLAKLRTPQTLHRAATKAKLEHRSGSIDWRLDVTSSHGKASSDAGWVGYSEKMAPFFGEKSAAKPNQDAANEVFDDLEKAWQAIFDDMDHDDEKRALAELADAMRREDLEHEEQLAYTNMELELEAADKISWRGEDAEIDVDLAISPNTFRDGTTLSANPEGRAEQFEKVWPGVVDEAFAAELREPWVGAVSEAASKGEFDFQWPEHYDRDAGADAVKPTLEKWLLGKRNESRKTWEDRLLAELKKPPYRIPFMAPTVKSAQAFLDKAIKGKGLQESWSTEVKSGRLTLLSGGGASPALKKAIQSAGIMNFLLIMARNGTVHEVTAADFGEEATPGPNSWFYRAPGGKLENRNYIKSRFRNEGQARQGKHEWIPCAKIIDIVEKGRQEETAEKGAKWLSLQDKLRSPTNSLVFRPNDAPDLVAKVADYVKEADGDLPTLATKLKEKDTKLDDYGISGHVGALYLQVDGERSAQTDKSPAFHKRLEDLFDFDKKRPETYGAELAEEVADRNSDAALWDGDVRGILPAEFEDKPYAELVPSSYQDKTGASWGEHLWAFKNEADERQRAVVKSLKSTKP